MVSSEEINRRLEEKRKGIKPKISSEIGSRVEKGGQVCSSCETENPSTAKYCVGCGKKLENTSYKPIQESLRTQDSINVEKSKDLRINSRPDDFGSTGKSEINLINKKPESKMMRTADEEYNADPV
ncbi:MAG: hypothetical protein ACLPWD_07725 [Methanobacterium sp.]